MTILTSVVPFCRSFMPVIADFDWDPGTWPKCGGHGVSRAEIEEVISVARYAVDDPSPTEKRLRTVGSTRAGRYVSVVFTLREKRRRAVIRPVNARHMHAKDVKSYEEAMAGLEK